MSEDSKLKVEGFERIKLKVRNENNSTQFSSNLDPATQQTIQQLEGRFAPLLTKNHSPITLEATPNIESSNNTSESSPPEEEAKEAADAENRVQKAGIQAPVRPTQEGEHGIFYDFNLGMRVSVPKPAEGEAWRIRLMDIDAEVALLDQPCDDIAYAATAKHHFLNGRIIISKIDKEGKQEDIFLHEYNAAGKEVLVLLPVGSLGDSLGWVPYIEKFRKQHKCKVTVAIGEFLICLFEKSYPEIKFVESKSFLKEGIPTNFYASYYVGLFFEDDDNHWQPQDFRLVGLHRTAGYILGVDPKEEPPKLTIEDDTRPIPEPYVVIATQASTQCKYWNNQYGWYHVIAFLKSVGYRVICIDKEVVYGRDLVWNHIPNGAEDQTGSRPLTERARWLKHAEFFVGLSSGLAWLAWGAGIPAVVISGFTHPSTEFDTPYRVFSTHVCNSCWNDIRYLFDHNNFLFCPKHRDTPRQFECTKGISHQQVINTILKIPGCRKEPIKPVKPEQPVA